MGPDDEWENDGNSISGCRSQSDVWITQHGIFGSHNEVTEQRYREPETHGGAVHHGHDGLLDLEHAIDKVPASSVDAMVGSGSEGLDIASRSESSTRPGEDDRLGVRVEVLFMEDVHELEQRRRVEGVQTVRTIERKSADFAIMTDEYPVRTFSHVISVIRGAAIRISSPLPHPKLT
jgi:hypothetical protein